MPTDLLDLEGQVAFVTGAGQGVGRAIAITLATCGASVAVNDFFLEKAEAVAEEIARNGGSAIAVQADVRELDPVAVAMQRTRDELGSLTLLINNAGMAGPDLQMRPSTLFWEEGPKEWSKYLGTNLYGVFNCCHAAIPHMIEAGHGRLVSIVSDAGRTGEARHAIYSAAKAGAAGFVRSIAKEVGRFGITSNAVSLSAIQPQLNELTGQEHGQPDRIKAQLARYSIRRFGCPEDVAGLVAFLCSDSASWITGQTYPVNGGYSAAL